jgi:NADH dehydrogenase
MELRRLGVELRMGVRVTNVDAAGVDVETAAGTERILTRTVLWAAGVAASPLAAQLAAATGSELEHDGRVKVLPDLSLPGHPEVFAVGDMTSLDQLPGVAEVAMQGGLHAANTILRRLEGDDTPRDFRYVDMGSVATIGRFRAIVSFHGVQLSGFPAWLVWVFVHLAFLNGFGSRLRTMTDWLRSFVGASRPERVFSTAHTGGDLSAPESVRRLIMPLAYPEAR